MRRALTDFEAMRAQELLVQRATEGLTTEETRELEVLGVSEVESFDLAAAMIDVGTCPPETMPDQLADAVLAAALSALRKPAAPFTAPSLPAIAASMTLPTVPESAARPAPRRRYRLAIAGALAAAMIAGLMLGRVSAPSATTAAGVVVVDDPASDDRIARWSGSSVTGSIRWSTARQRGVLELHGLPVNDPREARFQLWIFDRDRDARYPVDGGLFDVTGPDVAFAVQARVRVTAASEFLITREAPGGVVVSDRKNVVARAVVP